MPLLNNNNRHETIMGKETINDELNLVLLSHTLLHTNAVALPAPFVASRHLLSVAFPLPVELFIKQITS